MSLALAEEPGDPHWCSKLTLGSVDSRRSSAGKIHRSIFWPEYRPSGGAILRALPVATGDARAAFPLARRAAAVKGDHELRRDAVRVFIPLGSPYRTAF
jgi:hypothetical protein